MHIQMYTRRHCHLCETAWEELLKAEREFSFSLTQVDVDTDPELVQRYGNLVPVVTVDGAVRFWGTVNPALLSRLLRSEARPRA